MTFFIELGKKDHKVHRETKDPEYQRESQLQTTKET